MRERRSIAVRGAIGRSAVRRAPSASAAAAATPTPEPTPVPSPESELIVYNWLDYIGEDVIPAFEEKYPVKVKYELFDDIEVAYAKLGQDGAGYDISFPISVDVPRFVAAGTLIELDQSLLPNLVNLGPEWTDPGYDPGNKHSVPYVWWTTGDRLRHDEGDRQPDQLEGALGSPLQGPHLDDGRLPGSLRR